MGNKESLTVELLRAALLEMREENERLRSVLDDARMCHEPQCPLYGKTDTFRERFPYVPCECGADDHNARLTEALAKGGG